MLQIEHSVRLLCAIVDIEPFLKSFTVVHILEIQKLLQNKQSIYDHFNYFQFDWLRFRASNRYYYELSLQVR